MINRVRNIIPAAIFVHGKALCGMICVEIVHNELDTRRCKLSKKFKYYELFLQHDVTMVQTWARCRHVRGADVCAVQTCAWFRRVRSADVCVVPTMVLKNE